MRKRIYVAGGSTERLTVVRPMMAAVQAVGWELAHDWTRCEGYDCAPGAWSADAQGTEAKADLDAIQTADLVWFLWPEEKSEGIGVELGFALGLFRLERLRRRKLVVSGAHERCIFARLPTQSFVTHEGALTYIANL